MVQGSEVSGSRFSAAAGLKSGEFDRKRNWSFIREATVNGCIYFLPKILYIQFTNTMCLSG